MLSRTVDLKTSSLLALDVHGISVQNIVMCTYRSETNGVKVLGSSLSNEHGFDGFTTNVAVAELIQRSRLGAALLRSKGGGRSQQGSKDKGLHDDNANVN